MIVFCPALLVTDGSAYRQDAVDVALEGIHLAVNFASFHFPGEVNLTVCHIQRLNLCSFDQGRVDCFGIFHLVIGTDSCCGTKTEFVLACCRFLVTAVQ
jgi:hypothetical protein